jgi:short-subunit dehydrogenase
MRKVLITGASRGIGRALCLEIAKSGKTRFALISRSSEKLSEVKSELEKLGSEAQYFPCDVSNKDDLQPALKKAFEYLGEIHVAILNAGVSFNKWIFQEDYSRTFEEIHKTNVFSIAYALELLVKVMMNSNGKIVIVSSLADVRGFPSSSAYSSSKSAVTKLAEAARIELKQMGINVITVKPGFVATDMTAKNKFPMPFLMSADKAGKIIWHGIQRNKKIIAFPAPMVLLTKLISLLPNRVYEFFGSFYKAPE